jgi:hypothetical protein
MDWKTRATLWIAGLVLGAYFATTLLNCALDARCELRCAPAGVTQGAVTAGAAFIQGRGLSRSSLTRERPPTEAALRRSEVKGDGGHHAYANSNGPSVARITTGAWPNKYPPGRYSKLESNCDHAANMRPPAS